MGASEGRESHVISVIVPVLNEANNLPDLLENLDRFEDREIIVVDGGSIDESVAIARRKARVLRTASGRALQMNAGAGVARGHTLLFLHADTRLPDGALKAIREAMADERVVGGRFKVTLSNKAFVYGVIGCMINARDAVFGGFTGDQAIFVRARVFDAMGGYASMALMEDVDLARRLRRLGTVVRLGLKVETSARRWERSGVVRTVLLMWWLRVLYLSGASPAGLKRYYGEVR